MTREIATWLTDNRVGNNSVADHDDQSSLHCVIVSTDVMSEHTTQPVNEDGHSPRAPKVPGAPKHVFKNFVFVHCSQNSQFRH